MKSDKINFSRQLSLLQFLVWFKRSLRMLIRALWLGIAGFLCAWGLHELLGWFSDENSWVWVGVAFAALPLLAIWFSWPLRKRLVWTIDRKFETHEQVSTAWSVSKTDTDNSLNDALISDVLALFPRLWKRLLLRGWHLSRDLVALCLVLILGFGIYLYRFVPITTPALDQVELALLPPLGEEASAEDIFQQGILGLKPTPTPGPSGDEGGSTGGGNGLGASSQQTVQDTFTEMGEKLSQTAATYELGQALQSGDTERAASTMEDLADKVEGLDSSTLDALADAMRSASDALSNANEEPIQELSQDMDNAANELQRQSYLNSPTTTTSDKSSGESSAQDAVDTVASDLRNMEALQAASGGEGAGSENPAGESGSAEPAARLQGEGEELELGSSDALQPGMLTPASPRSIGYETGSDALSLLDGGGSDIIQTPLIPSYYPWRWRYVVATYFLHR